MSRLARRSAVAMVVVAATVVCWTAAAPALAQSNTTVASAGVADAQRAADAPTAFRIANRFGHPVAVDAETTPISEISVLPDGSMRLTSDSLPVRVKSASSWVSVDTTLKSVSGGFVAPKASAAPVAFSAGGSSVLAKVQTTSGAWITESWPYGVLPAPTLRASVATYSEVLPGVDLRLEATAAGMSEVLIVKTAAAAADPELSSLKLTIGGATVSADGNNDVKASASDGSSASSASPTWWDSSLAGSGPQGPGGDGELRPLDHSSSADAVAMSVDSATRTPGVSYPVYVDPDWSVGAQAYWFTDRAYPNQSYLNGQQAGGIQSVGYGGGYLSRAFWQFDISGLAGKHILSSQLSVDELWSNSCETNWLQLWRYGPATPGFTWNQDPGAWNQLLDAESEPYGSSCYAPQWIGLNPTAGVAYSASVSSSVIQLGLRMSDETDPLTRKHFGQAANLTVTYNSLPNTATAPVFSAPPRGCGSASSPVYVNGNQPITMQVNQTDPDAGQNVGDSFFVARAADLVQVGPTYNTSPMAQGNVSYTLPSGTLGPGAYAWRARGSDYIDPAANTSAWCYFTVKNTSPALPAVTIVSTPTTVGNPFSVKFTSVPGDAVGVFAYWWSSTAATNPSPPVPVTTVTNSSALPACNATAGVVTFVCPDTSGVSPTLTFAPVDDLSTLWVASYDAAGNVSKDAVGTSSATGFEVHASASPSVAFTGGHGWVTDGLTSPLPASIPDQNVTTGSGMTAGAALTIGAGTGSAASMIFGTPPPSTVLSLPGYVELDRFASGVQHLGALEDTPAPWHFDAAVGQLIRLAGPGQTQPAGTHILYSCALNSGDMETPDSTCEGTGKTAVPLGYAWNTAADVPAGQPALQLIRCYNAGDHSIATVTCSGLGGVEGPLGYVAAIAPTTTSGPVVDTTQSFSVSAWLNPSTTNRATGTYTAVSEGGTAHSGFYLQEALGHWRFCLQASDAAAPTDCAVGPAATLGSWTFVTGIWDAADHQLRLLMGSSISPVAVASHTVPAGDVSANGGLLVGSSVWNHGTGDQWGGLIDDPTIFPGVVDSGQLSNLYNQLPPQ
ncbi:MAG: hypothetical protein J0I18_09420 [Actinobacteria bacterium]|nr:hypothetical protein [Actinomycetota bacterium]